MTRSGVKEWLYKRKILAGFSPSKVEPDDGVTANPVFGVEAFLLTPNEDRVDEFACMVSAAVTTLVAHYEESERMKVNVQVCAR